MEKFTRVVMVTFAVGLVVVLGIPAVAFVSSPTPQKPSSPWMFVANLDDLPTNGLPRLMHVLASDQDAWTRRHDKAVGSVYVRRLFGGKELLVLEPHHGPMRVRVTFDARAKVFRSCWRVRFDLEGIELPDQDLGPMGDRMERLPVRVVEGQVLVLWDPCRRMAPIASDIRPTAAMGPGGPW